MSARLELLKKSLDKKIELYNTKIQNHIDDVKRANGQPLNDKRNGQATLNRWEKQNEAIRNIQKGIDLTKAAIEKEEGKIKEVLSAKEVLPKPILDLIDAGVLTQWRKYPMYFFVKGVDRCRIIWNDKKSQLEYKRPIDFNDSDQWRLFAQTYNNLIKAISK